MFIRAKAKKKRGRIPPLICQYIINEISYTSLIIQRNLQRPYPLELNLKGGNLPWNQVINFKQKRVINISGEYT